ncbi:MAG: lipoprotein [Bacteroidetes bacterium]|nr:lipoprotein [Bacteroidota bacterium]
MKRIIAAFVFILFLSSCAQSITPTQAANGGYKRCRGLR